MASYQERSFSGVNGANIISAAFYAAGAVAGVAFGLTDVYIHLLMAVFRKACNCTPGCLGTAQPSYTLSAKKLGGSNSPQPQPPLDFPGVMDQPEPEPEQRSDEPARELEEPVTVPLPPPDLQAATAPAAGTMAATTGPQPSEALVSVSVITATAGDVPALTASTAAWIETGPPPPAPVPTPALDEVSWTSEEPIAVGISPGAKATGGSAPAEAAGHMTAAVSTLDPASATAAAPNEMPEMPASPTPASSGPPEAHAKPNPVAAGVESPEPEDTRSEGGESSTTALSYGTTSSVDVVTGAPVSRRGKAAAAAASNGGAGCGGQLYMQRLEEKRQHSRRKGAHKATTR